jgi:threonine-phosphate decarboxylase
MSTHGGDVWDAGEAFGIAPEALLDFSANVNPHGLPPAARQRLARDAANARLLSHYPDPSARRLREALSARLNIPAEAIVVGPGAEALLAPILRCFLATRALVPVPAFGEYRRVCKQEGIEFVPFALRREDDFHLPASAFHDRAQRASEIDAAPVVILNNPHNPSGALLAADEVRRAAGASAAIIDEAFIDYAEQASLTHEAASSKRWIVLRSLTKFYGCPALRVGYAVAHPETIHRIRMLMPMWPVTQLAIDALAEAVSDSAYAEASLAENALERKRLSASLGALGLHVFPSAANYLLIELSPGMPASEALRLQLIARHRILIRNCDSYEGLPDGCFIRVAVRSREDNSRLIGALGEELRLK